jgi:hypothetical protein
MGPYVRTTEAAWYMCSIQSSSHSPRIMFFCAIGAVGTPFVHRKCDCFAGIHSVACAVCMCILAETGMLCQHKWVDHAALLAQSMLVMLYDWFGSEILPMVSNGPSHENYRGRMERVFPMQMVVTLGSHFPLNTPNPSKPTRTHMEWCFCAIGVVVIPFIHRKCDCFC